MGVGAWGPSRGRTSTSGACWQSAASATGWRRPRRARPAAGVRQRRRQRPASRPAAPGRRPGAAARCARAGDRARRRPRRDDERLPRRAGGSAIGVWAVLVDVADDEALCSGGSSSTRWRRSGASRAGAPPRSRRRADLPRAARRRSPPTTRRRSLQLAAVTGPNIGVNLDPSHFWWQGIDPLAVVEALGDRIGFAHAKDTTVYPDRVRLNGVNDHRFPPDPASTAGTSPPSATATTTPPGRPCSPRSAPPATTARSRSSTRIRATTGRRASSARWPACAARSPPCDERRRGSGSR